jgi:hypothetical protein
VLGVYIENITSDNPFGEILGGSLCLRLDILLCCTVIVDNLTDERVVIVNGKPIDLRLLFDHYIDDEDIQPISSSSLGTDLLNTVWPNSLWSGYSACKRRSGTILKTRIIFYCRGYTALPSRNYRISILL